MPKLFDEAGTEYEIDIEPDKLVDTLKSAGENAEALKTQGEELKVANEALVKLQEKDLNFKKLRDMSDDDKKKLTASELAHKEEIQGLEERIDGLQNDHHSNIFDKQLKAIVGEDAKLKEKVEKEYQSLTGLPSGTDTEVAEKLKRAYVIVTGNSPNIDATAALTGNLGGIPPKEKKGKGLSESAKEVGRQFGLSEEDMGAAKPKKKSKK